MYISIYMFRAMPHTLGVHAEAQWPPSTLKSAPVMKELPSDSKKTAGALNSTGVESLPRSAPAIHVFSTSGSAWRSWFVMSVIMYWYRVSRGNEGRSRDELDLHPVIRY